MLIMPTSLSSLRMGTAMMVRAPARSRMAKRWGHRYRLDRSEYPRPELAVSYLPRYAEWSPCRDELLVHVAGLQRIPPSPHAGQRHGTRHLLKEIICRTWLRRYAFRSQGWIQTLV